MLLLVLLLCVLPLVHCLSNHLATIVSTSIVKQFAEYVQFVWTFCDSLQTFKIFPQLFFRLVSRFPTKQTMYKCPIHLARVAVLVVSNRTRWFDFFFIFFCWLHRHVFFFRFQHVVGKRGFVDTIGGRRAVDHVATHDFCHSLQLSHLQTRAVDRASGDL